MAQIFGDFLENLPLSQEYLMLGFSPSSIPLQQRWRNNGLSADFLADYLTTFFPGSDDDPDAKRRRAEIKSAVGYIANELLENAMKFSDEAAPVGISIQLQLHPDKLILITTNSVRPGAVKSFQSAIEELIESDPNELYLSRLEANAADDSNNKSGLGLLMMINDYVTRIGWKFETSLKTSEVITVTTMVQLLI